MNEGLREAILVSGSFRKFAQKIGVSHQAVRLWSQVPAERVVKVETATGVSRYKLRPDIYTRNRSKAPIVSDAIAGLPEATRRAAARAVHALLTRDPDLLSERDANTMSRRLAAFLLEELTRKKP